MVVMRKMPRPRKIVLLENLRSMSRDGAAVQPSVECSTQHDKYIWTVALFRLELEIFELRLFARISLQGQSPPANQSAPRDCL